MKDITHTHTHAWGKKNVLYAFSAPPILRLISLAAPCARAPASTTSRQPLQNCDHEIFRRLLVTWKVNVVKYSCAVKMLHFGAKNKSPWWCTPRQVPVISPNCAIFHCSVCIYYIKEWQPQEGLVAGARYINLVRCRLYCRQLTRATKCVEGKKCSHLLSILPPWLYYLPAWALQL